MWYCLLGFFINRSRGDSDRISPNWCKIWWKSLKTGLSESLNEVSGNSQQTIWHFKNVLKTFELGLKNVFKKRLKDENLWTLKNVL